MTDTVELWRLVREAQKALGSFLWLGNNLHNVRAAPDKFVEFYEAALEDAQRAYDAIERQQKGSA